MLSYMKIKTIKMILESFKKDAKNVSYEDAEKLYNKLSKKEQKFVAPRGEYIESPKLTFRLGEYDKDDLMAFIDIYEFKKGEGFIIIAVNPDYRGKGLAKKLLSKAIKEAKEKGLKKLIYKVDNVNKSSISFIENFGEGFKEVEENKDDIVFEKEL